GSATRTRAESYLKAQHVAPPRLVLGSNGAVIAGAVAELGCALVSRDAIEELLADGRLVRIPMPGTPMRRPWHAVLGAYPGAAPLLFVRHRRSSGWRPHGPRSALQLPRPGVSPADSGTARRSRARVSAGGVEGPVAAEGGS